MHDCLPVTDMTTTLLHDRHPVTYIPPPFRPLYRPSTPVFELLRHKYQAMWLEDMKEAQRQSKETDTQKVPSTLCMGLCKCMVYSVQCSGCVCVCRIVGMQNIYVHIHIHYYLNASCARHTKASAACSTVKITREGHRIPSYDEL